jgi:hypothetical protein
MKIDEVIVEAKIPKPHAHYAPSMGRVDRFTDPDGWDRTHHLDRVMRAAAMSDGRGAKLDVDVNGWAGKYNTAHPYTDVEERMMDDVYRSLGTVVHRNITNSKRQEQPDTHKISPHRNPGAIKRRR